MPQSCSASVNIASNKRDLEALNPKEYSIVIIDEHYPIGLESPDKYEVLDSALWPFSHCQMWVYNARTDDYVELNIKGVTVIDATWYDKDEAIEMLVDNITAEKLPGNCEYTVEMLDAMTQGYFPGTESRRDDAILGAIHLGIIVLP